jgi:AcrR family transcriptional regulator
MPRAAKTEQEIRTMRARILDAAFGLLREEGPEGLSMRKIADRVSVSSTVSYDKLGSRAEITECDHEPRGSVSAQPIVRQARAVC